MGTQHDLVHEIGENKHISHIGEKERAHFN